MVWILMVSIGHSQTISKQDRIKIHIDIKGDTITTMSYADSKLLLEDVLKYRYTDSLLGVYKEREITYNNLITSQKNKINLLVNKNLNLHNTNVNLESMMTNRNRELEIVHEVIEKQEREIKRQKTKKVLGFIGAGALAITAILIAN